MTDLRKAAEQALEALTDPLSFAKGKAATDALRAALSQPAEGQEPPSGATHYQPHQKAYYKRLSATEWMLWSDSRNDWIPSPGSSDGAQWVTLEALPSRPAAQPVQVQVPEGWAASLRHVCDQLSELDDDTVQAQLPSLRAMLAAAPLPPAQPKPGHVGDSNFEGWFSTYKLEGKTLKQRLREAYAAGMSDRPPAQPVDPEPLSRQTLIGLWGDKSDGPSNSEIVDFGRAVERAHGITGEGA